MKARTKDLRPFLRWRQFCKEMVKDPNDMDSSGYSSYYKLAPDKSFYKNPSQS